MLQPATAEVLDGGSTVRLVWADGAHQDYCARWLFDHADEARDPVSGQRRHGALQLDAAWVTGARIEADALALDFPMAAGRLALARLRETGAGGLKPELWATPELITGSPPIRFDAYLEDDGALARALRRVARGSLVLLTGAGEDPEAVEKAVARFGFIRETNYGRLFEVRVEAEPANCAYSERGLDLHTDNPYRDPPPSVQLLHAICADAGGGGATAFVDGFAHAEALRRDAPDAFSVLARQAVRFTFAEASGARWSATAPVLALDSAGVLRTVRLNHRSLDLSATEAGALDEWYEAYLLFYRRLHAEGARFERRLEPGDLVIFDNRRILHGRRPLARAGGRWLRGAYADVDGLHATLARLERSA